MTTSSRTCPVPAVNGHMTHYPAAPYPLLFPPVIGGLSLPSLHGLQSHPPTSGCSTPSPASKCLVLIPFIDHSPLIETDHVHSEIISRVIAVVHL